MRALLALVLLASLAFAGCAGDKEKESDTPTPSPSPTATPSSTRSSTSSSGTASSSGSSTGPAPQNQAPTGSLSAFANGTKVLVNLTGNDPDGDTLSWTLDFGDGNATSGTTLPAALNHTYAAGNVTLLYNLTDGKAVTRYNATLNITGGGALLFTFTASTSQTGNPFTSNGGLAGAQPGFGAAACAGFLAGENGVDCVFTTLASSLAGKQYLVTTDAPSPDLEFRDTCERTGEATQAHGGALAGPVPAGSGCVVLWNFGTDTATFTFDVTG